MSTGSPSRVVLLAPMRSELQPIVRSLSLEKSKIGSLRLYKGHAGRTEVFATAIGVGPTVAAETTEMVLSQISVDHVIVCGIAGAVGHDQKIGSLVVPESVIDGRTNTEFRPDVLNGVEPHGKILTVGELILDDAALDRLQADGVSALDMESGAVGEVCVRLGYRWSVFRSISDNAREGVVDDSVLGLLRPDGSVDVAAAARLILLHPRQLPRLARLAKDSSLAAKVAARAAGAAVSL